MKKSITTLDLNLLLCLQLLMQERSVTKAAKRMNVTPSAVSKSLAKLRAWFDDPLFVNSPLGLSPTPLMVSMEQNLAEWMQMSNLCGVVINSGRSSCSLVEPASLVWRGVW